MPFTVFLADAFRFGFDISSMSAIIGTDQYLNYFNNPHGILQGGIASALAAGSIVGAVIAGPWSDWAGRRDAIWWSCLFWITGTAVSTTKEIPCRRR
jgi:MFS family permease